MRPSAGTAEIEAAYRRLLRLTHLHAGGSAALFRRVQVAYETLIDPERRASYDHELRDPSGRAAGAGQPAGAPGWVRTDAAGRTSPPDRSSVPSR